jgi:hypothetical protein
VRAKSKYVKRIKPIWVVQSLSEKYSAWFVGQISGFNRRVPHSPRGALRIVTNVERGMRWTRAAYKTNALICGRRSRVVATARFPMFVSIAAPTHTNFGKQRALAKIKILVPLSI